MKKQTVFCALCILLAGCSSQSAAQSSTEPAQTSLVIETEGEERVAYSCDDTAQRIISELDISSMVSVDKSDMKQFIDAELPQDADIAFYTCGSGAAADEIFIAETDDIDIKALETAVSKRIDERYSEFEDYKPEEADKIKNAAAFELPGYYMYFITDNNDKCVDTAKEMLY
jgi:hypothetical protein